MDASYYPQSQILQKPACEDVKREDSIHPVQLVSEIVSPEPGSDSQGSDAFHSCVGELLASCNSSINIGGSTPLPPEIKDFQRMLTGLQELDMLHRQKATVSYHLFWVIVIFC